MPTTGRTYKPPSAGSPGAGAAAASPACGLAESGLAGPCTGAARWARLWSPPRRWSSSPCLVIQIQARRWSFVRSIRFSSELISIRQKRADEHTNSSTPSKTEEEEEGEEEEEMSVNRNVGIDSTGMMRVKQLLVEKREGRGRRREKHERQPQRRHL